VPIVDLGLKPVCEASDCNNSTTVFVLKVRGGVIGAVGDSVSDVLALSAEDIEPAPEMRAIDAVPGGSNCPDKGATQMAFAHRLKSCSSPSLGMRRAFILALWGLAGLPAYAAEPSRPVVVAVPGPAALSYLPVYLIPLIGADAAEGFAAKIEYTDGGGKALEALTLGNASVAVAGLPAAMDARLNGASVVTFAAVNDLPMFVLMARAGLEGSLRSPADLKGRLVGVNTSAVGARTTSRQLTEVVARAYGVDSQELRILPAGQSWATQSAALRGGTVDALMGDQPFASRLEREGSVYFLFNLSDPRDAARVPGAGFLHAAAHVRSETIQRDPALPAAFARALRRSLLWLAAHQPHEVTHALGLPEGAERDAMEACLAENPRAFSRDGQLSAKSLAETEAFFQASHVGDARARDFRVRVMVDARWAGESP
jgi:ABC-type nitrate/sulfonate/bicarbonate transport system substrate-binding protein